jgi:hypothetical protein
MLDATRHVATVFLVTALLTEAAAAQSVPMRAAAQIRSAPSTSLQSVKPLSDTANQFQAASQHRCCNTKGAIIGAAAGAAVGWWFVAHTCDSSTCTSEYVKTIAILGGLGATFGVFADVTHGHTGGSQSAAWVWLEQSRLS